MTDREKTIAEIREALEFNVEWWNNIIEGEPISQDEIEAVKELIEANRFLLSELARSRETQTLLADRNVELAEENRKLREERDKYREEAKRERELSADIVAEREELIIENERLRMELEEYTKAHWQQHEREQKLIEGLRWYADEENHQFPETGDYQVANPLVWDDGGQRARDILKEIGVLSK